jgi:penicillin-binding protein 1B
MVHSLNVITVDIAMDVTIGRVMNLAARAGLPKPPRSYPAMALGTHEATPLQIASAYSAFATLGTRTSPIAINRVTTGQGVTVAAPTGQKNEVLRPDLAYVMTSFMKDVVNRGTGAKVRARGFKGNVAGKTGTSRDGWFAGYTPNLVCVVWVGFDDGSQLGLTGANSALPIWTDFMSAALSEHPEWQGDWQMPAGIEQVAINSKTGGPASSDDPDKRMELFINGSSPEASSELPELEPTPETEESPILQDLAPPPIIEALPGPSPKVRQPRYETRSTEAGRLEGTITLDIDPSTGLIAVESCPIVRTRTFMLGTEPRKFCGPEYHRNSGSGTTRPRLTSP